MVWRELIFGTADRPARFDAVRAGAAVRRAERLLSDPAPWAAEHLAELLARAEAPPPAEVRDVEQWEEVRAAAWAEALRYSSYYAVHELERRAEARRR